MKDQFFKPDWLCENAQFVPKTSVNVLAELPGNLFGYEHDVVVKLFGWRNTLSIVTSPFMRSRAKKSWDMAHWLKAHQIATPDPVAVFTRRSWGFIRNNFFVSRAVKNYDTARSILRDDNHETSRKDLLVQSLASIAKNIHQGGMIHNDLTLANFLVQDLHPEAIFLVDLNRATRPKIFKHRQRIAEIARMDLCKCDYSETESHHCFRDLFLQAYDKENYIRNKALLKRLVHQRALQKKIKRFRKKLLRK